MDNDGNYIHKQEFVAGICHTQKMIEGYLSTIKELISEAMTIKIEKLHDPSFYKQINDLIFKINRLAAGMSLMNQYLKGDD